MRTGIQIYGLEHTGDSTSGTAKQVLLPGISLTQTILL